MTDRELLEFAAKSTGMKVVGYYLSSPDGKGQFVGLVIDQIINRWWNPKTNADDALDLAMTLAASGKLRFQAGEQGASAFANDDGIWVPMTWSYDHSTPVQAFCGAITQAAAAIGQSMQDKTD